MKHFFKFVMLLLLCTLVLTALVLTSCDSGDAGNGDSTAAPPVHTHAWGAWSTTTPATCVAKGEETRSCTCGESEKRDIAIDADAHAPATEWTSDDSYHWHDCTACGSNEDKAEHSYNAQGSCKDCFYYVDPGLVFIIANGTYTVTDYTGSAGALTIPSTYKGVPVTAIAAGAFSYCTELASITIPQGVTSIGPNAFFGCTGLTSITIPSSVTSIGYCAFYGCTGLEKVVISDIAAWCNILFDDDYAANPLRYAHHLYLGENEITELVIPSGVTSIGQYAFYGCTELAAITIPSSVTSIGSYAFEGCTNLTHTVYQNGKYLGNSENPYLYLADVVDKSVTSFTIPNTTRFIGYFAFDGCTGLTSITIPQGVTSIGSWAFLGCTGLESVTFGENSQLTTIGSYAFENCRGLTSITIPQGVMSIGSWAFSVCTELTSVSFENTEDWWVSTSSTATTGTGIASESLANQSTAAEYLTSTYGYYYWKRR